ncbi:MAG TPA: SRPBCC domain-containing protein [Chloroflexota bacterium]|nr:SRPBCC domain-containing protein [Chloroflexota bacterium]
MSDATSLGITRTIDAPREEIWNAWTDPAILARWWWPERFETTYAVDLRTGGGYRFVTTDVRHIGTLDLSGTFSVVEPPSHLSYSWSWASDGGQESHVTVDFAESFDGGTEIRVKHHGLKDAASRNNHVTGWNDCVDRLEMLISKSN